MSAQLLALLIGLINVVSQIVTTRIGFKAVEAKLTNYVPVSVYSAKVKELHDEINALKIEVAVLKDRNHK